MKLLFAILAIAITGILSVNAQTLTISELPHQTNGVLIQTTASEKLGFHGATPVVQRAGAAQAAVATSNLTISGTYSQAEIQAVVARQAAVVTLLNEIRAALVAKGLIKGSE